ncbi:hypothetical protein AB3329_01630 [Streptococcus sp. H31]
MSFIIPFAKTDNNSWINDIGGTVFLHFAMLAEYFPSTVNTGLGGGT